MGYIKEILTSSVSILLFIYDIGSDVALAIAYYRDDGHWLEFGLTSAFIIGPLTLCAIICLYYACMEHNKKVGVSENESSSEHVSDKKRLQIDCDESKRKSGISFLFCIQLILTFPFCLGPILRHFKILVRSCQKKETHTNKIQTRTAVVILIEGYYESASQLLLQLYFSTIQEQTEDTITRIVRFASLLGSGLGLAWALVSVRRTNRLADHDDDNDESYIGSSIFFLARLCEIGPRIVIMAMFATVFKIYVFVFIGGHCILSLMWTFCIDRTSHRCKPINVFFKLVLGYPMLFCFIDIDYIYTETPREHIPTRYKMTLFYLVFYAENGLLFTLWIYNTTHEGYWFYTACIAVMSGGLVLHFFFQILYYLVFHPKHEQIKLCMSFFCNHCFYRDHEPDEIIKVKTSVKREDNLTITNLD